ALPRTHRRPRRDRVGRTRGNDPRTTTAAAGRAGPAIERDSRCRPRRLAAGRSGGVEEAGYRGVALDEGTQTMAGAGGAHAEICSARARTLAGPQRRGACGDL